MEPTQSVVNTSVSLSLGAQWITLIIGLVALWMRFPPLSTPDAEIKPELLPQVLTLEMLVQIVELVFYTWYLGHLASDVAAYRYFDWVFTTPLMLISTAAFFSYITGTSRELGSDETKKRELELGEKVKGKFVSNLQEWIADNFNSIAVIVVANFVMLLLGYLQEMGTISILYSTVFGFGAFIVSFYELYRTFVGAQPINQIIYWIMFGLWGLYGFAAMLSPISKNLSYNILDIFSKNFYGVFLAYILYTTPSSYKSLI